MAASRKLIEDSEPMSQPAENAPDELSQTLRFQERAYNRFYFIISAIFLFIGAFLMSLPVFLHTGKWLYTILIFAGLSVLSLIPLGFLLFNDCFFEVSPDYLAYIPWFGRPRIIQWHQVDRIVVETSSHGSLSLKIVDTKHDEIFPDARVPESGTLFRLIFGHLLSAGKRDMLEEALKKAGLKLKKRAEN